MKAEATTTIGATSHVQLGATLAVAVAVLTVGAQLAKVYGELEGRLARIEATQAATAHELETLRGELTACRATCAPPR